MLSEYRSQNQANTANSLHTDRLDNSIRGLILQAVSVERKALASSLCFPSCELVICKNIRADGEGSSFEGRYLDD